MSSNDIIILNRDVDAMLIPSGARIYLQEGTEVMITQSLGGSYTVSIYGNLARIDEKDADAIGQKPSKILTEADLAGASVEDLIWRQLKTCYDPEIPVNIVDLGLIYECRILELEDKTYQVHIVMTLTAPGCGMGPTIAGDVKRKALAVPRVEQAEVEIVFDPPWSYDRMSDVAKLELGML